MKQEQSPVAGEPINHKKKLSVMIGAAFLMATSAIGPGFLTQATQFTEKYMANFAFVIVFVCILDILTQLKVWSLIGVTGLCGQDLANKILPGLGYFLAGLVALGGFAFNCGNVGGVALGLNVLTGISERGCILIGGTLAICICLAKNAETWVDRIAKAMGIILLLVIGYVAISSRPPVGTVVAKMFMPDDISILVFPIISILGGTAGGYVPFAGAHRLLDAGICGIDRLKDVHKSLFTGIGVTTSVRILLFLATLGVCTAGATLDPSNPAASVFLAGAGNIGYTLFGVALFAASITSVLGASYTSVSFLKTFHPFISKNAKWFQIGFICLSTLVMFAFGKPATLVVFVSAINGLILPISLTVVLLACRKKSIVGDYKHPPILILLGIIVVLITGFFGIQSLGSIVGLLGL